LIEEVEYLGRNPLPNALLEGRANGFVDERGNAAWTLALLSVTLSELVTASTLPRGFYNPLFFLLLLGMYGGGVLLVREFVVRLHKGPASLIAAGLAYAVLEEALVLRSWFDPNYPNVQGLGWYGRVFEVNALWALWVTPLLALISTAIPIFLTDLLFPEIRGKPLLGRRALLFPAVSLAAVFGVTRLLPQTYATGPIEYAFAAVLAAALVGAAYKLPRGAIGPRATAPPRRAWPFMIFGGVWCALDFFLYSLGPALGYHPIFSVLMMVAAPTVGLIVLQRFLPPATLQQHLFLFFVGVMGFFAAMDILRGLAGGPLGLLGVGIGFMIFATAIYRDLWPADGKVPSAAPGSPPPPAAS